MGKMLVYDLPTRVFHWLFAGLFIATLFIAKYLGSEELFHFHMFTGLTLGFIVALRIVWGWIGTKHARFASWPLHPKDLVSYFVGILSRDRRRWAGHNPASSWATLLMILLTLGMVTTGMLMTSGVADNLGDVHRVLAYTFLIVVIGHLAGVILHTIRHRDGIGLSMLDGKKVDLLREDSISSSKPAMALLFVALTISFTLFLVRNFDAEKKALNLLGTTLHLGGE